MIRKRLFRRIKTGSIGVILPKINSAFLTSVITGMEKYASENGFQLLVMQSLESAIKEIQCVKSLQKSGVDGIMASLASDTKNMDHFTKLIKKGIPILFFDRVIDNIGMPCVVIDNKQAAFEATQHLISKGCKRIVHITGNLERNVFIDRLMGYKEALLFNHIEFDPALVFISELGMEAGDKVARQMLEMQQMPDAVFAVNDLTAASCMRTLKKNGIKIPKQVAIVGFNNDPISLLIEPNITTVNYPGFNMGLRAAQIMVNHLKGLSAMFTKEDNIIRTDLIIRASSNKIQIL